MVMDHQQKMIQFIGIKQSLYKSDQIKCTLLTINRYNILEWSN